MQDTGCQNQSEASRCYKLGTVNAALRQLPNWATEGPNTAVDCWGSLESEREVLSLEASLLKNIEESIQLQGHSFEVWLPPEDPVDQAQVRAALASSQWHQCPIPAADALEAVPAALDGDKFDLTVTAMATSLAWTQAMSLPRAEQTGSNRIAR